VPAQGNANLDFGTGTSEASVIVVTAGVTNANQAEAWKRLVATADHDVDDVRVEPLELSVEIAGLGGALTIYGEIQDGITHGLINVNWAWA
jgi:hypothetical protein